MYSTLTTCPGLLHSNFYLETTIAVLKESLILLNQQYRSDKYRNQEKFFCYCYLQVCLETV